LAGVPILHKASRNLQRKTSLGDGRNDPAEFLDALDGLSPGLPEESMSSMCGQSWSGNRHYIPDIHGELPPTSLGAQDWDAQGF
jgi:hypothetical protein